VAQAATRLAEAATGDAQRATLQALEAAEEAAMLSRTLQESLLPPHLPAIPGMQIAARYLRGGHGADVLGDFYDVFRSVRGGWGAVVGDVAGKGPQAAKTTALARYTLRASAARALLPSTNLNALNAALIDWFTDDTQFVTAVYASVRPHPARIRRSRLLRWARPGPHPPRRRHDRRDRPARHHPRLPARPASA
jgi:serine phosphatase RsbU (regulator of sigma subunit)